jgi:hypothetical protein
LEMEALCRTFGIRLTPLQTVAQRMIAQAGE